MRKFFLGSAALLALMGAAGAADLAPTTYKAPLPRAAAIDWSGFYLGLNGGYGRSNNCWDLKGANVPIAQINPANPIFIGVSAATNIAEGCNNGNGAVAGGQVGYRYQLNSFVFGLEAQGDWANLKGSNNSAVFNGLKLPPGVALSLVNTSKVDAIGLFTGQVGYSFGPVLWYVKGGAAVTNNEYDGALALNIPAGVIGNRAAIGFTATDHASAVRFGEVIGTGVDVMFAPGWSVGIDYNHLFMGSQTVGFAYTGSGGTGLPPAILASRAGIPSRNERISGDIDMATVRLNYSFGH